MDRTELYRDIAERTNGDIYIGVVEMCIRDSACWFQRKRMGS